MFFGQLLSELLDKMDIYQRVLRDTLSNLNLGPNDYRRDKFIAPLFASLQRTFAGIEREPNNGDVCPFCSREIVERGKFCALFCAECDSALRAVQPEGDEAFEALEHAVWATPEYKYEFLEADREISKEIDRVTRFVARPGPREYDEMFQIAVRGYWKYYDCKYLPIFLTVGIGNICPLCKKYVIDRAEGCQVFCSECEKQLLK